MDIADNIKIAIKNSGYNVSALCRKIQISRTALYAIMNGQTLPAVDTLANIAEITDVSIDKLIYGKEKEQRQSNIQTLYNLLNEPNRIALEAYAEGMAMAQYGADLSTLKERYDRED